MPLFLCYFDPWRNYFANSCWCEYKLNASFIFAKKSFDAIICNFIERRKRKRETERKDRQSSIFIWSGRVSIIPVGHFCSFSWWWWWWPLSSCTCSCEWHRMQYIAMIHIEKGCQSQKKTLKKLNDELFFEFAKEHLIVLCFSLHHSSAFGFRACMHFTICELWIEWIPNQGYTSESPIGWISFFCFNQVYSASFIRDSIRRGSKSY